MRLSIRMNKNEPENLATGSRSDKKAKDDIFMEFWK